MANVQDATQQALILAYEQTIGRNPTPAELALSQQQLGSGTPIASVRAYLANSGYGAAALARLYSDVVGRAPTLPELAANQGYLANGGSLATLRNYFAATNEAAGKLRSLYATELNRAVTPAELAADERLVAGGSSLAAIRGYLSTSAEAVQDLTAQFKTALGTAPALSDLQSAERALAGGASQPAAVAGAPGTAAFIDAEYRLLLGVAPSTAPVSAIEQGIAAHLTKPYPGYEVSATTLAAQATTAAAAATPQFTDGINAAYQAAAGRQASPVELAAAKSELGANPFNAYSPQKTVTLATLKAQIAELSGGAPPQVGSAGTSVEIRPQTVLGTPGFISGLPNNIVLISASQDVYTLAAFQGSGSASINTFDTGRDTLQIPKQQAADFNALTLSESTVPIGPGDTEFITHISLPSRSTIDLPFVTQSSLTPANFQFV